MRTHGTLTKWNNDRGFGFITPAKGTADLFADVEWTAGVIEVRR